MVVKYSRDNLLEIRKGLKAEELANWLPRAVGKPAATPVVVSKKKGARAASAAPKNVWERLREERDRKSQTAASAKAPFQTTFSEGDRARLAMLREQLRGKSLPPPTTAARDEAAAQPAKATEVKQQAVEVTPTRKRQTEKGTPQRALSAGAKGEEQPKAATPAVVKKKEKKATIAANTPSKSSPEKKPSGKPRRPGGWAEVADLPKVDIKAVAETEESKKGLNAGARAFFPNGYAAGVPFMRVEVPRREEPKTLIQMLKLKPNDTVCEGRRVPPNKRFLLAMHPNAMGQYWNPMEQPVPEGEQPADAAADASNAITVTSGDSATSPAPPEVRAASADSGAVPPSSGHPLPLPAQMWGFLGMPPPSEAEAEAAMREMEHRQRLHEMQEAVRRKRDEDRANRYASHRDDIHATLLRKCADVDKAIDAAVDQELAKRPNWEDLSQKSKNSVRKEYRTQRLRSERLEVVRDVTKTWDLSAKAVANHVIEIITTKLVQKMCAEESKLERKKRKWLKKMIAETSEEQVERRMFQRKRQLDIGSNTLGYAIWEKVKHRTDDTFKVPKPVMTPIPELLCSKRGWDGLIRQWRHRLHQYDKFATDVLTPEELVKHEEEIRRNSETEPANSPQKDDGADEEEDAAQNLMVAAAKEAEQAFGVKEKSKINQWEQSGSK